MPHIRVRISIGTYPNRQGACKTAKRFASGRIGRARQRTTHHSPTQHCGPGTAASGRTRPSQTATGPAQIAIGGPAPLQLQVVLERGEGELSLRTSNGANHAQRGQQSRLGADPGRYSNGAAPLVIVASRQRRLAGQHLLTEEVGAHLAEEAVQTVKVHLRAGALDVSQPLLDADMERYRLHVWEASIAR